MSKEKLEILERALKREKAARKAAEQILEKKSRELYLTSEKLKDTNSQLISLLEEKSSTLEGVFKNINDAYLVMDLYGNVLKMNEIAVNLFEHDINNEAFNVSKIIHEDDIDYTYKSFSELYNTGHFNGYTARIYTKTKKIKWIQVNATVIYDRDNKAIAAQGIIRDITKDKEAGDLLMESKNRLSALVLNLNSGIVLEDENRKIVLTNNKFCELFKIPVTPDLLKGEDCTNAAEQSKSLFKNPDTFTSFEVIGSLIDLGTDPNAA